MSYILFDEATYLDIPSTAAYFDYDRRSRMMIDDLTDQINELYGRDYASEDAFGIEPDGCSWWFFIGFPEADTETNDGYKWYIMHNHGAWVDIQSTEEFYANKR